LFRLLLATAMFLPSTAIAMDLSFEWADTPACNTGWPDVIDSPVFEIKDVPEGTQKLKFSLKDLDAPGFSHGGGTISYDAETLIDAGAFTYKGPCPPNGKHEYQWTMTALDFYGDKLGTAKAVRFFPE
jgi:phosphatidylethanolamine-binding protein (PEBP) family uncharacterized protein